MNAMIKKYQVPNETKECFMNQKTRYSFLNRFTHPYLAHVTVPKPERPRDPRQRGPRSRRRLAARPPKLRPPAVASVPTVLCRAVQERHDPPLASKHRCCPAHHDGCSGGGPDRLPFAARCEPAHLLGSGPPDAPVRLEDCPRTWPTHSCHRTVSPGDNCHIVFCMVFCFCSLFLHNCSGWFLFWQQ